MFCQVFFFFLWSDMLLCCVFFDFVWCLCFISESVAHQFDLILCDIRFNATKVNKKIETKPLLFSFEGNVVPI